MNTQRTHRPTSARWVRALAAATALVGASLAAQAQVSTTAATDAGYIGLNVGRTQHQLGCGALYSCDANSTSYKLTAGQNWTRHFGTEVSLGTSGKLSRGGGETSADMANISVVGRVPVDRFTLYGKLGTTYGRTEVSTATLSDINGGKRTGWGPSGGVGVAYDLTQRTTLALEWERNRLNFAGAGRSDVDATSVGLRWRY